MCAECTVCLQHLGNGSVDKARNVPPFCWRLQNAGILQHLEGVKKHGRRERVCIRLSRTGVGWFRVFGVGGHLARPPHRRRPLRNVLGFVVMDTFNKRMQRAVLAGFGVSE